MRFSYYILIKLLDWGGITITTNHEVTSFDRIAKLVCKVLNVPNSVLSYVLHDKTNIIESYIGFPNDFVTSQPGIDFNQLCSQVIENKTPLIIEELSANSPYLDYTLIKTNKFGFMMILPFLVDNHITCLLGIFDHHPRKITNDEIETMMELCHLANREIQAKKNLQESQQLLQEIAENIKEVFWIYDLSKEKILYISPAWEEIWGRPAGDYYRNPWLWDESIHPDDLDIVKRIGTIKGNTVFEYRIYQPEGSVKWIRDRIVPLYKQDGTFHRLAGIAEDITEEKLNEDLLRKSDKLAVVGQLAAGFAHEIRNPLTTIKGFLQFQQTSLEPYSNIILSELNKIEGIITEFLFLAKPHQETVYMDKDIVKILKEVISLLEPQLLLSNIKLKLDIPDEPCLIHCEEGQIKQVLINVINNAIEASNNQPNDVYIKLLPLRHSVCIQIIDNGIGISEDRIAKLGEPFYSNKEKGFGLGLMVCFKIIENHRGQINITSELNKGTNVSISLPGVTLPLN